MTNPQINLRLFLTILVVTVLPLTAAVYLTEKAVTTSLNLGFNRQIVEQLEADERNLRTLGRLDPDNLSTYRSQFDRVAELKAIYASPDDIKTSVSRSLLIYFSLGVAAALLVSLTVATLLSRQISRSYRKTFDELIRQGERVRYLEEFSSWQELAKILAHEIKNPLTPIQVLTTTLARSYRELDSATFAEQLARSEAMIVEELAHLNATVSRFSDFAKLPTVEAVETDLRDWLVQQSASLQFVASDASIELIAESAPVMARIDSTLMRRAIANIVRNGVEANPERRIRFIITLSSDATTIRVTIANDGAPVPTEIAHRLFDPYISGTKHKDNMGLGLAIARKIMLEHGGDIAFEQTAAGLAFTLSLPRNPR
jgi:signal transduction histidine kinase